jgi:hypothetical protein
VGGLLHGDRQVHEIAMTFGPEHGLICHPQLRRRNEMSERTSYTSGTPCWIELSGTPDVEASESFYRELFGWEMPDSRTPCSWVATGAQS